MVGCPFVERMSKTVTVTAIRTFPRDGGTVVRGQAITCEPLEAATMARKGLVTLSKPSYRTRQMTAPPAPPEPPSGPVTTPRRRRRASTDSGEPPSRRTYRRRDMTAEPTE